jgi:hypothetical protein
MPDRGNPKDMRLYCAYFPLSSLSVGNERKDRLHGLERHTGLNDCLDLIPDRSLVAHCIIGVLFQPAARRFSRLRAYARTVELAGRASTPPGRGTRGQCAHACGNPPPPSEEEEEEAASQRALNDPSLQHGGIIATGQGFFVFVGREAGAPAQRLLAGSGPEIRAPGRPLAVLVDWNP